MEKNIDDSSFIVYIASTNCLGIIIVGIYMSMILIINLRSILDLLWTVFNQNASLWMEKLDKKQFVSLFKNVFFFVIHIAGYISATHCCLVETLKKHSTEQTSAM